MLTPTTFHDIVSGRKCGVTAAVARCALACAELPYAWATRLRNRRFDLRSSIVQGVEIPVISVGNLTMGGTGKTPMVRWLANWFQRKGISIAIVSRGYGSKRGARNDEAKELEYRLPLVPHLQNPKRILAARRAIDDHDCQIILLDDAFQHRQMSRDLDIVLIDALQPFGFGHIFPRGTLRESIHGLKRADLIVLTRSNHVTDQQKEMIRDRLTQLSPRTPLIEVSERPSQLRSYANNVAPVQHLSGKWVFAFCGIGNPSGFRKTLASCGYRIAEFKEYPDHYEYAGHDIRVLTAIANRQPNVSALVCTEKDLVKLGVDTIDGKPVWALDIELEVVDGEEPLIQALSRLVSMVHG